MEGDRERNRRELEENEGRGRKIMLKREEDVLG